MSITRYIFCSVLLFSACVAHAQAEKTDTIVVKPPQARIEFAEPAHDFGKVSISKKPKQTHTFVFTNTGNKNLYILEAISGCGCTTPKFTKDPVKPGAKGKIVVTYDATGRQPGSFNRTVTVYTNDPRSYTRIRVNGEMVE